MKLSDSERDNDSLRDRIQIFLAHAQEDKEEVLKLYARLKKAGYQPWLDQKDLIPGQNWRSVIPKAIKDSQLFIACLSKRSISKRGYVQNEFKIALNQLASLPSDSIYLIPLRLDECEIPDLRQNEYGLNLRDLHWLDYWETDGFENLVRTIEYQFAPIVSPSKESELSDRDTQEPTRSSTAVQIPEPIIIKPIDRRILREEINKFFKTEVSLQEIFFFNDDIFGDNFYQNLPGTDYPTKVLSLIGELEIRNLTRDFIKAVREKYPNFAQN